MSMCLSLSVITASLSVRWGSRYELEELPEKPIGFQGIPIPLQSRH